MLEPGHRLCAVGVAKATALALVVGACTALTDLDYLGRGGEDSTSSGTGAGSTAQGGGDAATTGGGCDASNGCAGGAGGTGGGGIAGGAVGGAASGEGGGGGTPDNSLCFTCGQQSCTNRGLDCFADPTCSDWLDCVETCANVECTYTCDDMYSPAHLLYEALYSCLCMSCLDECALADPCNHGN